MWDCVLWISIAAVVIIAAINQIAPAAQRLDRWVVPLSLFLTTILVTFYYADLYIARSASAPGDHEVYAMIMGIVAAIVVMTHIDKHYPDAMRRFNQRLGKTD